MERKDYDSRWILTTSLIALLSKLGLISNILSQYFAHEWIWCHGDTELSKCHDLKWRAFFRCRIRNHHHHHLSCLLVP